MLNEEGAVSCLGSRSYLATPGPVSVDSEMVNFG
jgi:hypothetical protein